MTLPITIDEILYAVVLLIGAGWPSSTVVHEGVSGMFQAATLVKWRCSSLA